MHKQSIGGGESQGSHPLPGYLQGKISVTVIIWKGYKMPFFFFSFSSLEISVAMSHQQVLSSLSLSVSIAISSSLSLSLILSVTLSVLLSLSESVFWSPSLFFLSHACFCMCLCLSVFISQILWFSLFLYLTLWFCLHFPLCFFLSASLWFPLCLCLSDHLSGLSLILSPSFPLSLIPFLPPCSPFLVAPGFLGKVE